jgi:hypothetical protein
MPGYFAIRGFAGSLRPPVEPNVDVRDSAEFLSRRLSTLAVFRFSDRAPRRNKKTPGILRWVTAQGALASACGEVDAENRQDGSGEFLVGPTFRNFGGLTGRTQRSTLFKGTLRTV